jgi:hypothetical protein
MKIKTDTLTGLSLNLVVALCEGHDIDIEDITDPWLVLDGIAFEPLSKYKPSTDWAHGGPIIEREGIRLHRSHTGDWWAGSESDPHRPISGPTPLIAAMRCYVTSHLGDEADIPEELTP